MRLLVILGCAIAIQGSDLSGAEETHDKRITINGVHYAKEVLKSGFDNLHSFAIDSLTNTLYFSYVVNDDFAVSKVELDTRRFVELDLKDGCPKTIDEKNHVLYVGTTKGIHVYDMINNTNKAPIILPDTFIWLLHFNKILYYADFRNRNLYTFVDGVSKPFEDLKGVEISHFCIDKDGDMFYNAFPGLVSLKKGDKTVVRYQEFITVTALATDIHGNVFVCAKTGIYKVDLLLIWTGV